MSATSKAVTVGNIKIDDDSSIICIAGPCVLEDYDVVMQIADRIQEVTRRLGIPWIFKASYLKDNRSNADSYKGPGLHEGLTLLETVRRQFEVPIISDIHSADQAKPAAEVLDVLQIPAFLCQQTSLLLAAGNTGNPINIKKGQFLSPWNICSPVGKIESTGNTNILLTERGTSFGYDRLIVDMSSVPIMQQTGYPVFVDATHAVRIYGRPSSSPDGGHPEFVPNIALAGVAAGCNGLYLEVHTDPLTAKCDAASMLNISQLERILSKAKQIHRIVNYKRSEMEDLG